MSILEVSGLRKVYTTRFGGSRDAGFYQVISDTLTMLQAGGDAR